MELRQANPRRQGDIGELSAMEWLASQGAHLYIPVGHSPEVDLIADFGGRPLKIQVKTSISEERGRYRVHVCTMGGNQSWNGLVKLLDPGRYDFLFVLVSDGRRWFIPSHAVGGRRGILLGGPKYSEFQVDTSDGNGLLDAPSRIDSPPGELRRRRTGPVCKTGGLRLSGFESHLPHPAAKRPYTPGTRTTISPQHKITIPITPFRGAGLRVGDRLSAEAAGPGRVVLTRIIEDRRKPGAIPDENEAGAA
jgi:PD-(D/E)XK endonuclease